jgi:N6-adenosine-specific RNA methylase IME4
MIPFHPLADIFPLIEGHDFDDLVRDISQHGLREPIVLLHAKILDGRNRYRACVAAKLLPESLDELTVTQIKHFKHFITPGAAEPSHEELLAFVLSKNLHRRHMDESQRAMVADNIATLKQGARTDLSPIGEMSQEDAAKLLNVGKRSVERARVVREHGTPDLIKAVEQGQIAVSVAAVAAYLPPDDQHHVVEKARAGHVNAARTVVKQKARSDKEKALADKQSALPDKRFGVILADPEWKFETWSENGMDRAADNHYPTSELEDIKARDVATIAAPDCVLFLWATAPMLPQALAVMAAWGFDYKSHLIWEKDRIGTGYWFRNMHELLLVGTRGNVPAPAMGTQWDSVQEYAVGKHSAKPASFYELIEQYFPTLSKIELNARKARPGWDVWGNEAPTDEAAA